MKTSTLHATRLLECWERGLAASSATRALLLLGCASPHQPVDALAAKSVGEVDGFLIGLYERLFGPTIRGYADCTACGERSELSVRTEAIRVPHDRAGAQHELRCGDYSVRFRSLTPSDLETITPGTDPQRAEQALLGRCVLAAQRGETTIAAEDLPREVVDALSAQLGRCDPQAEVVLDVACAACGSGRLLPFDIVTHFWTQLDRWARGILREVHCLAAAYGWSERSVLRLSARRRAAYLRILFADEAGGLP